MIKLLTASANKYIEVTGLTMEANDQVVTGKTKDSLRAEVTNNGYKVYINDYAGVLQDGRRPGKLPPIEAIAAWVRAKGLDIDPRAVAWKLKREGSQLWRGDDPNLTKPTDTFTEGVEPATQLLRSELIKDVTGQIRSQIIAAFK